MAGDAQGGRFRDALRSRDFRLLVTSLVIDGLGSWASSTVLAVYVFERTGSTTWIAVIASSNWIPRLVLGRWPLLDTLGVEMTSRRSRASSSASVSGDRRHLGSVKVIRPAGGLL